VADIELPPPTTGQLAGQSPGTLYVEYKQETGIDSAAAWNWWNPPENKVYLHWRPSCPYATHLSLDCSVSYLIDTVPATTDVEDGGLAPGESWIDPTSTLTVSVTSRASDLSSATITFEWTSSTPSAPAGISLERTASGTVRVAWSAAIAHGNTVRGYRVRASGDGGQQCTTTVGVTDNPLTCEVSGLTNGVSYTFGITASSDMGAGPAATSAVIVAAAPPTAPTSVSAARSGSGALQVSWAVPQNSGGVDLSSYRVSSVTGGKSCTVTAAPGAQPARTCTVTGLTNGTSYQFRVLATNTAGLTSDQSAASTALTPATSPGPPTSVSLTRVGSGALKVSWKAPSSTGGVAVTSYSARSAVGGRSCTAVAPATSCTVAGLTNGTSYRFQVVATNAAALASVASALSPSLAPGIAPGAPSAPSATRASATSIKVIWKAPSTTGGLPLTGFTVTVSGSSRGCSGGATATSCTVTGLTRWTTHKVAVTARNDAGSSRVSAWSAPVTLW
jgi:titin